MRPRQPSDTQKLQTPKQQASDRLAKALRENLYRRKAQARARSVAPAIDANGPILSEKKEPSKMIKDVTSKKTKS